MAETWKVEISSRPGDDDMDDGSEGYEWSDEDGVEVGGIWSAGRRELTPVERRVLWKRAVWMRVGAAAAAMAFPLVFLCVLAVGVFIEEAAGSALLAVVAALVLELGAFFALVYLPWMSWQESGALNRDRRRGSVGCFKVVTRNAEEYRGLLDRALQTGLLQWDSAEIQTLEMLTEADLIWRVNGVRPEQWQRKFSAGQ